MTKPKLLNVGIDLGTSRSVIACDNGMRMFLPSYVGFPKAGCRKRCSGRKSCSGKILSSTGCPSISTGRSRPVC